jgi:hypothetical protein
VCVCRPSVPLPLVLVSALRSADHPIGDRRAHLRHARVCMYLCVCVCVFMCVCICICVCVCVCVCVCIYMCVCVYPFRSMCVTLYARVYFCVRICVCVSLEGPTDMCLHSARRLLRNFACVLVHGVSLGTLSVVVEGGDERLPFLQAAA